MLAIMQLNYHQLSAKQSVLNIQLKIPLVFVNVNPMQRFYHPSHWFVRCLVLLTPQHQDSTVNVIQPTLILILLIIPQLHVVLVPVMQ